MSQPGMLTLPFGQQRAKVMNELQTKSPYQVYPNILEPVSTFQKQIRTL